jgi:tetratricopeptide (TPR) repeat protein
MTLVWICASFVVVVGVLTVKWIANSSRVFPTREASSTRPSHPAERHEAVSDSEKDRDLRREQLETAEKLLTEFPTNDDAVYLAGLIHEDQGNSEQAMKLWERSIELDATRADANESLGQALLLRDDYAGAEKYLRRALALDSNSPNARFRLATALSQQSRLEEARSGLEQGPGLSAEAHRLLAEICHQLKQYERAKTNYEAAIKLKPEYPEAYYGLAQTLAQLGESARSQECIEKSAVLRRQSEEQARRVRTDFDSLAITRKSVARTHTDVGRVYIAAGKPQKAEELWLRAAKLDSQNVLCRLQLAVFCQQARRERESLQFYDEAAKLDPSDGLTQLNMGRVCMKLNQPERAERAFKEVIRLQPKRPEGFSALAQLYLQNRNNPAEAERLASVATELAREAPYFALLSQACAQNGNHGGALSAINRAIELQPANQQFVQMRETLLANKR